MSHFLLRQNARTKSRRRFQMTLWPIPNFASTLNADEQLGKYPFNLQSNGIGGRYD